MIGIDIERIKERAREIRESQEKIRHYAALPETEFFADERNLYTVMHLLLSCYRSRGFPVHAYPGQNRS